MAVNSLPLIRGFNAYPVLGDNKSEKWQQSVLPTLTGRGPLDLTEVQERACRQFSSFLQVVQSIAVPADISNKSMP